MEIKMLVDISGVNGLTGKSWPRRGKVIKLPAKAALRLVDAGMAVMTENTERTIETARLKAAEELATPKRRPGRPKMDGSKPRKK